MQALALILDESIEEEDEVDDDDVRIVVGHPQAKGRSVSDARRARLRGPMGGGPSRTASTKAPGKGFKKEKRSRSPSVEAATPSDVGSEYEHSSAGTGEDDEDDEGGDEDDDEGSDYQVDVSDDDDEADNVHQKKDGAQKDDEVDSDYDAGDDEGEEDDDDGEEEEDDDNEGDDDGEEGDEEDEEGDDDGEESDDDGEEEDEEGEDSDNDHKGLSWHPYLMPLDGGIGYLRAPPDRCSMCSFHFRTLADCLRLACACSASVPSGFSACVPLEYAFLDGIMPCVPGIHAFPHAFRGRIAHSFDALRSSFRHRSRT
ncbi:hypothetical protein BU14_0234s0047, partial [Porphyra umbilicalis]